MSSKFLKFLMIGGASLLMISCGAPAANNSANRPANAANNAPSNTAASSASAEADVKKLMTDLAAALAKNDADAAAKFYSEDYHLITPDGIDQSKAARIADIRSGTTKFDSFAYENVNVRSYGDTAVAIATVKARGIVSGKPRTSDMIATLVLHKAADGWKVVSGQATAVAPASTTANTANTASSNSANSASNANAANR
jgi:uncharacterized protein (TIGR02246 family)